jgi:hypothetical protein
MKHSELIAMLKSMMEHGMTLKQTIELLEAKGDKKKIGRLKEKQIIKNYEKR